MYIHATGAEEGVLESQVAGREPGEQDRQE